LSILFIATIFFGCWDTKAVKEEPKDDIERAEDGVKRTGEEIKEFIRMLRKR